MEKEKIIDGATECGGSALGAVACAGISAVIAGPEGAIAGALLGTVIENTFKWAKEEIKTRCLSKAESNKLNVVYELAKEKISEKLTTGKSLRQDVFFDAEEGDRTSAEEILEGTLFAAQRENEEKKLPYLANLYANINFDESISRPMSNQLIKLASAVSYRQLVILSVIGKNQDSDCDIELRSTTFRGFENYQDISIAAEIYDLYRSSLIISSDAILDAASFTPALLVMNGLGELLYRDMELYNMPMDKERQEIIGFLTDGSPIPAKEKVVTGQLPIETRAEIDAMVERKTADIPRLRVQREMNSAGGETVTIG